MPDNRLPRRVYILDWGKRERAPPVVLNVPPVYIYICTYVLVPGWPHAMRKRKAGLITSVEIRS